MAKLTPTQWKELEAGIHEWRSVRLRINGHEISIFMVRSGMKLKYEVYVDGYIKGDYTKVESEIGKAFFRPMIINRHKAALLRDMVKIWGVREAKKMGYFQQKVVIGYSPYYSSFRSLKQVLCQHDDIEILEKL
jgi:hypothetical protein